MFEVARRAVSKAGTVRALFAGSAALMGRAASFNVAQLLTYDASKQFAVQHLGTGGTETLGTHIIAALLAGVAATAASAPFENAKTHAHPPHRVPALSRFAARTGSPLSRELLLVAKK